ncbi:MAG TPA: DUF1538 domain-containing protein [Anaerovoracaceae bacterium]|nr:DUF1538 domain-containing protein [Anaerovoracaceae bacterium]
MNRRLFLKTQESFASVMPIAMIVLFLNFTISPMPFSVRGLFLMGTALLIAGMGLFTLGADIAMIPMGEQIGAQLVKSQSLKLLIGVSLVLGVLITYAEPDVRILARLVPTVPDNIIILSAAAGVGIFLIIALLRILFQWKMTYMLVGFYLAVLAFGFFTPENYLPVAFDAGGVSTGPITVPLVLALGIGLSSVRGGRSSNDDSFGLVAFCSIGPIPAIMIMGMLYSSSYETNPFGESPNATDIPGLLQMFGQEFPIYFTKVGVALLPIIILFLIFQLVSLKLPKSQLIKIGIGILYTYLGLVLFLAGVNVGFIPAGAFLGKYIGGLSYNWILIPLGMVMGYFVISAEPTVHILVTSIEEITGGAISKKMMFYSVSIGVAVSIGLSMVRILYGINIWYFLVPGYILTLALTFLNPQIFVAVAFDAGGVAPGPMSTTFFLPFAIGVCEAVGGNILTDAFGIIAMVALTPLIAVQVMGLIYKIKVRNMAVEEADEMKEIAEEIEEEESLEWFGRSSDITEYYGWEQDTEFVENVEWASDLREEKLYNDIVADNDYIDFDELEKLVIPEDFDYPRKNGKE